MAVADFGSNPTTKLSMGTKMPPPPTPPTLPQAAPRNPIIVPRTIFQPNSSSCEWNSYIHMEIQTLESKRSKLSYDKTTI